MKRSILLILMLVCSTTLFADTKKSADKIAVINIEQSILTTNLAKSEIAKLEADPDFKKNMASMKKIQEEGQALAEKYNKDGQMMSQTDLRALEEKIKTKQSDLEHVGRKLQETRNNLLKGLMMKMNEAVTRDVKAIIESENIGILLPYNPQIVLHADSSLDITSKLTAKLNEQFKDKK